MSGPFGAYSTIAGVSGDVGIYRLEELEKRGLGAVGRLPNTVKVLLEAVLRNCDGKLITEDDVAKLASWADTGGPAEIAFLPARVLLQDFTGVPAVVDLAAMREAMKKLGGDPDKINPLIPADLVIDHSIQVDRFGTADSLEYNTKVEFERNKERYQFLKWGQSAFQNFRVVPPATGICHQVNLEYLAPVVQLRDGVAFPDSLVGTDSHTTMINGLGVLGWGVGGIEAEATMLGQPIYMVSPTVVGLKLTGELAPAVTATDLVLTVTELLRNHGVVGKLVEFYGPGLKGLTLPDRAVLANMAPEYGATAGFFPVDEKTLEYLRFTGRGGAHANMVERYTREQGLFGSEAAVEPAYSETLSLDLSTVVPCIAGPRRPQDRIALSEAKKVFLEGLPSQGQGEPCDLQAEVAIDGKKHHISDGAVVIAAITSCTNTSNPSLLIGAGMLARNAHAAGLTSKPWVKTSFSPGSRVVTAYMEKSGLTGDLDALGFQNVGYGCTTCIGNSGPLPEPVAKAIKDHDLVAASVLSGNRNFEGRIHPLVKENYLASPMLVVAYALAGWIDVDFDSEPLGKGGDEKPVFLRDIWPSDEEIERMVAANLGPEMFSGEYSDVFKGDELWAGVKTAQSSLYDWQEDSTYIRHPAFFEGLTTDIKPVETIENARALAVLGGSVTTDHISPAGAIAEDGPAAKYLESKGVTVKDFNSFGSRRGNHEVMMRGTFANVRLRNLLVPGSEGGVTEHLPSGEVISIFDAAERYKADGTALVVLAGKDYGMGSSRDWAAKGTSLLGVKAVIAESYERIHRSNLVGMGVLPLQFEAGESGASLELTGRETFNIEELEQGLTPGGRVKVRAVGEDGVETTFTAVSRLDTPVDVEYYRNGGILQTVLRKLLD